MSVKGRELGRKRSLWRVKKTESIMISKPYIVSLSTRPVYMRIAQKQVIDLGNCLRPISVKKWFHTSNILIYELEEIPDTSCQYCAGPGDVRQNRTIKKSSTEKLYTHRDSNPESPPPERGAVSIGP